MYRKKLCVEASVLQGGQKRELGATFRIEKKKKTPQYFGHCDNDDRKYYKYV